ncbi:hypothetical protein, partial [Nocardia neocaledoniensis]|uniref:hypothetical protein n=1 Tax=Nocardia neocaledoniensis TaxID=236511 RepID=UPI002456BD76
YPGATPPRPRPPPRPPRRPARPAPPRGGRADGWAAHREAWSEGQVAVVAYLLDDADVLTELGENEGTVLSRYAADLYGFVGGRKDNEKGLPDTQAWFDSVRKDLGRPSA